MTGILKYMRGYVQIKVWGFAPERFLNLCSNKDILLWDIRRDGDIYYMCISLSGFRKLRKITRKTRTRVVILQRYGLPFFIPKVLARRMFVAGLLLACFFWFWTSKYVWEIDLSGNLAITEDVFMEFLESQGVQAGMRISDLDIESLEKEIRREFTEITWTSAKLSGTNLEISVKENDAVLFSDEEDVISDLYADCDGVITSMIVRSGVPQVKIGDTVKMGDLLISGRVPVYNEDATLRKYQYVRSDGDIYVERIQNVQEMLPFDYVEKVYTGREEKKYFLLLFGKELSIGGGSDFRYFDVVTEKKEISFLKDVTLPLSFGSFCYREYLNEEREYSLEEAQSILSEKYERFLVDLQEKGVQILERNVKMDTGSGFWELTGELQVKTKIGLEIPIDPTDDIIPEEGISDEQ